MPEDVPSAVEEIAVDAESYRPLRMRYHFGNAAGPWWRVVELETLARDEGQFAAPEQRGEPRLRRQTGTDERTVTPAEAATALDRPALWPGQVVRGIDLTRIDVVKLTTEWTDGRETEGRALKLQYGEGHSAGPSARWLIVVEGTSRDELPRFDTGPPFASGQLRVMGFSTSSGDSVLWLGAVELDGVFITLESPNRDVVLAAARALKQMP